MGRGRRVRSRKGVGSRGSAEGGGAGGWVRVREWRGGSVGVGVEGGQEEQVEIRNKEREWSVGTGAGRERQMEIGSKERTKGRGGSVEKRGNMQVKRVSRKRAKDVCRQKNGWGE